MLKMYFEQSIAFLELLMESLKCSFDCAYCFGWSWYFWKSYRDYNLLFPDKGPLAGTPPSGR